MEGGREREGEGGREGGERRRGEGEEGEEREGEGVRGEGDINSAERLGHFP